MLPAETKLQIVPRESSILRLRGQSIGNLRQYHAIAMDVGDLDHLRIDAGKLHDVFNSYGIVNKFEIYHGTHTSAVADRFQNHVMPFFSPNLCAGKNCR